MESNDSNPVSIKQMLKEFNENIGIVTLSCTLFGIMLQSILKGFSYLHYKAKFDLWNIPNELINVHYTNSLYGIIVSAVFIFLLFAISYILYSYGAEKNDKGKLKWKNIIAQQVVIVLSAIVMLIYTFVIVFDDFNLINIIEYIKGNTGEVITIFVVYFFVLDLIVLVFGKSLTSEVKYSPTRNKKPQYIALMIFVLFIFGIAALSLIFYSQRRSSYNSVTKIDIVTVNENKYVLVNEHNNKWIVKECIIDEEGIHINKDSYMLIDIEGLRIVRQRIKDVSSHFIDNSSYEMRLKED